MTDFKIITSNRLAKVTRISIFKFHSRVLVALFVSHDASVRLYRANDVKCGRITNKQI